MEKLFFHNCLIERVVKQNVFPTMLLMLPNYNLGHIKTGSVTNCTALRRMK